MLVILWSERITIMYSLEILVLRCLFEISAWGGVLIGSRILDWGGCFSSYHSNRIKIERKGNAHEGTLLAHIDRNHRNDEESIILYWFLCKVVNKVAVETDFPCVPIICKSEGGEWGGGGKGAYLRGELVWHYDPVSGYLFGGGGEGCAFYNVGAYLPSF